MSDAPRNEWLGPVLSANGPTISAFEFKMQSGNAQSRWLGAQDLAARTGLWGKRMWFMRWVVGAVLLACVCVSSSQASATGGSRPFMRVHGQALPPFGFVHFCRRHREECAQHEELSFTRFNASPSHLGMLDRLNREINALIKPVTDLALYGQEEYWTFPSSKGDCEDYVVLKRRLLIERGWPASALLITVVLDEQGDGHAVLTVRTKQGDFVLDNKVDDVRLWSQTPYRYLMRQSYLNPRLWMALDPRAQRGANTVAGVNSRD